MSFVDETATKRELLNFLRGTSKSEIIGVALGVRKCAGIPVLVSGSKTELLDSLSQVSRSDLWNAVDAVFPDSDESCEDEECSEINEDHDDEDSEDEDGDLDSDEEE